MSKKAKKKNKKPEKTRRAELEKGYKTIRVFRIIISVVAAIFSLILLSGLIYALKALYDGISSWGANSVIYYTLINIKEFIIC